MKEKKSSNEVKIPKLIIYIGRFLLALSPKLAEKFARKLFTTPIKHKIPKREWHMNSVAIQTKMVVPEIQKEIVVYQYGNSNKKILLVHGWSGRGTQLVKIADELLKNGYATISFDAPAHGKSSGKTTLLTEFIASICELEKKHGPFEYAIGHSLGGMAILNAIKLGINVKKVVLIASGNSVLNIVNAFVEKIGLPKLVATLMKANFEKKYQNKMENFAAYRVAPAVFQPVLLIHDENDEDIPVSEAHHLAENLINKSVYITKELGHRKILGDLTVINKIVEFLLIKK